MIQAASNTTTVWTTDSQFSYIEFIAASVTKFSRFINDLIKRWKNIICKLDFSDSNTALSS